MIGMDGVMEAVMRRLITGNHDVELTTFTRVADS
jgi:hypothetical protein